MPVFVSGDKVRGRWKVIITASRPTSIKITTWCGTNPGSADFLAVEQLRLLGFNSEPLGLQRQSDRGPQAADDRQHLADPGDCPTFGGSCVRPDNEGTANRDLTAEVWKVWNGLEERIKLNKEVSWSVTVRFWTGKRSAVSSFPLSGGGE